MKRREFLTLIGGAAALPAFPRIAHAQQPARKRLIAVEMAFAETDPEGQRYAAAFQQELQQLGWTLGRDLQIEYRYATDAARAKLHAVELVALKPDLIVAHATIVTRAIVAATRTIPVVFTNVSDPVGEGFVKGFPRPGGNITGFVNVEPSIGGKYLELLKAVAPGINRAAMIFNPKSTPGGGSFFYAPFEAAGSVLSIQPIRGAVQNVGEIEDVISALARDKGGGLVVVGEPFINLHRSRILELTGRYRLPAICPYRFYAANGCLLSYGVDFADQFRRAAIYANRILRGDSPANLPVQSPVKFELVVNVKTAQGLGLSVPSPLLVAADEVIE